VELLGEARLSPIGYSVCRHLSTHQAGFQPWYIWQRFSCDCASAISRLTCVSVSSGALPLACSKSVPKSLAPQALMRRTTPPACSPRLRSSCASDASDASDAASLRRPERDSISRLESDSSAEALAWRSRCSRLRCEALCSCSGVSVAEHLAVGGRACS